MGRPVYTHVDIECGIRVYTGDFGTISLAASVWLRGKVVLTERMTEGISEEDAHKKALALAEELALKMQDENIIVDIQPNRKDEYSRVEIPNFFRALFPLPRQTIPLQTIPLP